MVYVHICCKDNKHLHELTLCVSLDFILMLIVYLPKIFSSEAGLFRLDPLLLLSAGTVLSSEHSVRCVSGVLVCVPHLGSL